MNPEKRTRQPATWQARETAACCKWNRGGSLLDLHTSERQVVDEEDYVKRETGRVEQWFEGTEEA